MARIRPIVRDLLRGVSTGALLSVVGGGAPSGPPLTQRIVANRTKQTYVNTRGSDGINTHGKYLSRHRVYTGGCSGGFKLVYANRCREAPGFSTITVSARVRYPSGTGVWQEVKFSDASSVTMTTTSADVISDPLSLTMAEGERFDVETYVQVGAVGGKWPTLDAVSLSAANGEGFILGTSDLSAQTPSPSDTTEFYGPIAILGLSTASRAVAVIGDSIANGAYDNRAGDRIGFVERVFGPSYPVLQLASSGEKISEFVGAHSKRIQQLVDFGVTDIVFAFGTNDAMNGDNQNLLRHNLLTLMAYLATKGKAITVCPILTKTDATLNPSTGFTVGGVVDLINALMTSGNMGLASKVWDIRAGWQNASNQILSATYTDDYLHPNVTGNAAIAAAAPAAESLLATSVPLEPVPSDFVANNWKVFVADDLDLADGASVPLWASRDGTLVASQQDEAPTFRRGQTPTGKGTIRFDITGTGLQKLVIPSQAGVNNIMDTGAWGAIYTITRPFSAGGSSGGRVWQKGAGEAETFTSTSNLRTTIDFNTTDIQLNGSVSMNNWLVRQVYKNASNGGTLLQNTINTATASATGSSSHVDNSAYNFIIGNHDTLPRGFDGDIALIAIMKGGTATADQLWSAQAYFRALTGVTLVND